MMNEYFQFTYPGWLYLLPLLLALVILRRGRGADGSIDYPTIRFIRSLARKPESLAGRIGAVLLVLSAVLTVIALAQPKIVNEKTHRTVRGVDIMIDFDLSGSMDTPDMVLNGRQCDRLTAAKFVISHFIEQRPDDRIGIVGFAAKTKSFCPLTLDHLLAVNIIKRFTTQSISADGTAIGSAIAAAATRLENRKDTKSKIIILVTDGASNSGQISPIEAATAAAKLGIKIYTIAVGSEEGTIGNGLVASQNFDEPTLRKIASITGGEHFRATDTNKLTLAFSSIDKLEKTEAKIYTTVTEKELFPYFLTAGGILALLGLSLQILRPNPAP